MSPLRAISLVAARDFGERIRSRAFQFSTGFTLLLVVICGTLCGATLPLIFERLGWDPALMSSPFVAGIIDIALEGNTGFNDVRRRKHLDQVGR